LVTSSYDFFVLFLVLLADL